MAKQGCAQVGCAPATAALEAPVTLAWKARGAVSLEVEVTGTEMVRRRLL